MAEQSGTPNSNGDGVSFNGSRGGAPKDKACPFCNQPFTSSSLGRHLDLYIKEKNPKAADGIHDVDEIRKLRGGITRRQPRNSTSRREGSTPAGTPGAMDRRSPERHRSPSSRRESEGGVPDTINYRGKPSMFINRGTWESTGVMNHIPAPRNSDTRSWDGEEREGAGPGRRAEVRSRSVSKQILAKSTFEQKQKMMDAIDNAKAAELALRELLGSLRAAKAEIEGPSIFTYDPLTLDFPSLCLQCLPAPPTLHTSTPVSTPQSWSLNPPEESQYLALRNHFAACFNRYRVSLSIATTAPRDHLSYPVSVTPSYTPSMQAGLERAATNLESQITQHLHSVYSAWTSLPPPKRSEIWTLTLARSISSKSAEIQTLQKEKALAVQEAAHLRQQVDELSRLQHPREFKISPPVTIPMSADIMHFLGEQGTKPEAKSIGFDLVDRGVQLDAMVSRAIGRWKNVVSEARQPVGAIPPNNLVANGVSAIRGGGMRSQRSLSGESAVTNGPPPSIVLNDREHDPEPERMNGLEGTGSDADADADADMEDDESNSFVEMSDAPPPSQGFRMANGRREEGERGREGGVEVQGYVRGVLV